MFSPCCPPKATLSCRPRNFVGDFRFDVTTEGTVNYDQGYDGFASGRGSSQLVVGGFPITIDGTGLSHDLQPFLLWGNSEILSRDSTHLLTLLPAKGYAFLPSSQFVGDFRFDAAHLQMFCKYLDRSVTDCIRAFESWALLGFGSIRFLRTGDIITVRFAEIRSAHLS